MNGRDGISSLRVPIFKVISPLGFLAISCLLYTPAPFTAKIGNNVNRGESFAVERLGSREGVRKKTGQV